MTIYYILLFCQYGFKVIYKGTLELCKYNNIVNQNYTVIWDAPRKNGSIQIIPYSVYINNNIVWQSTTISSSFSLLAKNDDGKCYQMLFYNLVQKI